jgi:hypothetical protein
VIDESTSPPTVTLEQADISGWTISWVAQLGKRDIQDLEEGLRLIFFLVILSIKQILTEAIMHPDAKKAIEIFLQNANANTDSDDSDSEADVPNEDYLVSSLFCLFESTTVTNSFKITDKGGKDMKDRSVAFI